MIARTRFFATSSTSDVYLLQLTSFSFHFSTCFRVGLEPSYDLFLRCHSVTKVVHLYPRISTDGSPNLHHSPKLPHSLPSLAATERTLHQWECAAPDWWLAWLVAFPHGLPPSRHSLSQGLRVYIYGGLLGAPPPTRQQPASKVDSGVRSCGVASLLMGK